MSTFRLALGLVILLGMLGACDARPPLPPLPTLAARARVPPPAPERPNVPLPATFTPVSTLLAVQPTLPPPAPTHTPTPTPPLFLSPTAVAATTALGPPTGLPGVALPSSTSCDGRGDLFYGFFPSHYGPRRYAIYLPPCYGDGRVYPTLYLFHGSIQDERHWLDLGLATLVDDGIATGRYPSFIVVMPYNGELGNMTSGGANSIEGVTVSHLLPFVEERLCSWPARAGRALGGISRGGYWALEIAFRQPFLFGSVSGHSSHLRLETDAPRYNPLSTYASADLSGLRIWLDWGETDFLRPGQEQLREALAGAGIAHTAFVNPGGHSDAYWRAHLRSYLDWHAAAWPTARDAYPACDG